MIYSDKSPANSFWDIEIKIYILIFSQQNCNIDVDSTSNMQNRP